MNNHCLLIIFAKNPILHCVKTRLAAGIGAANALRVYQHLLIHTRDITKPLLVSKAVYYADFIPAADIWDETIYEKHLQNGVDLGMRMNQAFNEGFDAGFTNIVIIGSDNYELTVAIIEAAFFHLTTHDYVIGPAVDGGYYLLGMKALHRSIFENKQWSTATVLRDTLTAIRNLNTTYHLLPTLRDVDTVDDLGPLWQLIENPPE